MLSILLSTSSSFATASPEGGPDIPWLRLLIAFVFCVSLAVVAILLVRTRNRMPPIPERWRELVGKDSGAQVIAHERIDVIQRIAVSPGSQIIVLRRGAINYLLHVSQSGVTEIDRYPSEGADKA